VRASSRVRPIAHAIGSATSPAPDRESWAAALGVHWRLALALLVGLAAAIGGLAPVADPDITIHLATGEWIRRHGAVPLVEPFAWTRAGQPFYAYSWAMEVLYAQLWQLGGLAALQALRGLECALAVLAVGWLGRTLGWRPWTIVYVAALNLDVALRVAPFVRPQFLHFIAMPIAWGLAHRIWRVDPAAPDRLPWRPLVALGLLGMGMANAHLLFPLTAVPVGLVALTADRLDLRRFAAALGALALGWLASPNAPHWPAVFVQNFAPNALITYPSPIAEYQPGFLRLVSDANGTAALALLLVLPWVLPSTGGGAVTPRARAWFGVAWLVGLLGFGLVGKSVLIWWLALLPMAARVVDRLPAASGSRALRLVPLLAWGGMLAIRMHALARSHDATTAASPRAVPTLAGAALEPLLARLERETGPAVDARVVTTMEFGGYLTWRAPRLSPSIDGRTIFPDSIAGPQTFVGPLVRTRPLPPIAGADLALLPLADPAAAVLDTAAAWQRVATSAPRARGASAAGLWARRDWWERARTSPARRLGVAR
jgi:hypothetical protein